MLRNENTHRLTIEGNAALIENQKEIQKIYQHWRNKGYSVEEVFYMISTAAHECGNDFISFASFLVYVDICLSL